MLREWSKYLLLLLVITCTLCSYAWAHGDDDHGNEPSTTQTTTPIVGDLNIRVAATTSAEVMLKYPRPVPGNETPLRIFVTDVNSNAPISGLNIKVALEQISTPDATNQINNQANIQGTTAKTPTLVNAFATEQSGIYQAQLVFANTGQYKLSVQLNGQNINAQLYFDKIAVTEKEQTAPLNGIDRLSLNYLVPVLLIIFIAMAGLFFWLRSREEIKEEVKKDGASIA